MVSKILLIFIKNPRLGHVKTRLARTVGDAEALRIYQVLLGKTCTAASNTMARRLLFYSESIEENDAWPVSGFEKHLQSGGDLGARMEDAFRQAFAEGVRKVIIIGSDCPELSGKLLNAAFEQLDNADMAIGPTPDGGYYLLGMRRFEPAVFRNVAWSTEHVFTQTADMLKSLGYSMALLPSLPDIDTEEDWRQYEDQPL